MDDSSQLAAYLQRNAVDALPSHGLEKKLEIAELERRPLRVKLGIDPTAPDIHLGHTVVLTKLREFQDAGHTVVLILGDYTAQVGDPTGRSKTRPELSLSEIEANAATFQEQAFKVLDRERVEIHKNSEWLDMTTLDLFKLMRIPTVAQLLERDDFSKRYAAGTPIALLELLYPLLQAFDSVAIESDVEIGGTDQKFNLLLGRDVQSARGMAPQAVLTMPILPGTDGVRRMGKSLGNHIGVTEPPEEIFGKVMSIPDDVMPQYYDLLFGAAPDSDVAPVQQKRALARAIVARFHSERDAEAAEFHFDGLFKRHVIPDQIEEFELGPVIRHAWASAEIERREFVDNRSFLPEYLAAVERWLDLAPATREPDPHARLRTFLSWSAALLGEPEPGPGAGMLDEWIRDGRYEAGVPLQSALHAVLASFRVHLPALGSEAFGVSRSDFRRRLDQGGVKLGGSRVPPGDLDWPAPVLVGDVLQMGKRNFVRLVWNDRYADSESIARTVF